MKFELKKTINSAKNFINSKQLWWSVILLGVYLRLHLFLRPRSLWGDEASLAINIVSNNFSELARLLDFKQAAPVGFLYIQKIFLILLGNHDQVMRLFPLIAGTLAIYFIFRFTKLETDSFGLVAVVMIAFSWWAIHYSTELKQYSSDSMTTAFLVFLAGIFFSNTPTKKDFALLIIGGSIAIWLSHPSIFVLASIGIAILIEKIFDREYTSWSWIFVIGLAWLFSFGVEYCVSLQHTVNDGYMLNYWRGAFVPSPPWSNKAWYWKTFLQFLDAMYHKPNYLMAAFTLIFVPIGSITALLRNRKVGLMLILPFVFVYIASALQRYPLRLRFFIFLTPLLYLLLAEGLRGLYHLISKFNKDGAAIISLALTIWVALQILSVTPIKVFNDKRVDARPVIRYIAENRKADEVIYVFARTESVFSYYAPQYGIKIDNVIIGDYGSGKRAFIQNYQKDIVSLQGEDRVWFLFTEVADCPNCQPEDTQSFFLDFIDLNGGTLLYSIGGPRSVGANAYLYDMNP